MDIDIDFLNRSTALETFPHIVASINDGAQFKKHNTGVYFQNIPCNPLTNQSTVDHKEAENRGYFKIDFLNVSAYEGVRDEAHLVKLINQDPEWSLLLVPEISDTLFHLNGYSHILQKFKPTSIEQLAIVLALIRPAKRHLIDESYEKIQQEVWVKPTDPSEYFFKKSHSFAYAMVIVVQLNLLVEQLISSSN